MDIDLYADVESDFPAEDLANEVTGTASSSDLYDDVLTNIKDEKSSPMKKDLSDSPQGGHTTSSSSLGHHLGGGGGRRFQLYVGNLTWWTTDADIADVVLSVGVNDFLEVKFYENRANGQSKGFCCVSTASEASMKVLMEKLPKKELHGQVPVVTYATKQALHQFEAQSKTRPPQVPPPTSGGPPPVGQPPRGPPLLPSTRPTLLGRPMGMSRGPPPSSYRGGSVRGPPPHALAGPPPHMTMRVPPPMGAPPPGMHSAPPPGMGGPPPMRPMGPAPHVNPAFFPPVSGPPPPTAYPPPVSSHGLNEVEFEEIMSRNRTVSSSAIARAVQDASCNEYGSAIETLVTAISLIKQSKVAHDDRCKILVSSLQDTLHGIENKSYGAARRDRSRSRERSSHHSSSVRTSSSRRPRSYSREREYRERSRDRDRERDYYRERSRSRERDYRREEKYYEERERYKERERAAREAEAGRGPRDEMERDRRDRGDSRRSGERDKERERPRH